MKKIMKYVLCLMTCLSMLSGCVNVRTKLAYTIYPVGYLIGRLGGDVAERVTVQENTVTLVQNAQIADSHAEIFNDCAAFFHIGELEPYLELYADEIAESEIEDVDLSAMNAVYDFKRYTPVMANDEVTFVESAYYKGDMFSQVDTTQKDLSLWLDPIAMLSMAGDIRDWLIKHYPEKQSEFEENYSNLENDLINIDAQYQKMSTNMFLNNNRIAFVSMTASFGNWQKTYGIEVYPVILSKYGVLPTDSQLEEIKRRIVNDGVHYIVYEPNMTSEMIDLFNQLEEELDLTRVNLSNLSSLSASEQSDGKDYLSVMYENLSVLKSMEEPRTASVQASGEGE